MENSVTAAPLLVRKGIKYTKLAVTLMGEAEERRGVVLHLGTGQKRMINLKFLKVESRLTQFHVFVLTPMVNLNNFKDTRSFKIVTHFYKG